MMSYMNEYTHEYWRGNEDRSKAPDYVFTKPAGGGAPFLLYYGRIGGVNFSEIEAMKNQRSLKKLHDDIIADVCNHNYLSDLGKKGGSKTSEFKKKSSPENGKLGGRPRLPAGFGYKKFISVAREYRAGNAGNVHNPTMVATQKGFEIWSDMSIDRDVVRICVLAVLNGHTTCTSYNDYHDAIETIKNEKPEFLKINTEK